MNSGMHLNLCQSDKNAHDPGATLHFTRLLSPTPGLSYPPRSLCLAAAFAPLGNALAPLGIALAPLGNALALPTLALALARASGSQPLLVRQQTPLGMVQTLECTPTLTLFAVILHRLFIAAFGFWGYGRV